MKVAVPKNIFEVNRFCDFLASIIGYKFVTISRTKNGKYSAKTSFNDYFKLLFTLFLIVWLVIDLRSSSFERDSKRSLIFEIMLFVNGKVQGHHMTLILISSFLLRFKYFEITSNIQWIDNKVRDA